MSTFTLLLKSMRPTGGAVNVQPDKCDTGGEVSSSGEVEGAVRQAGVVASELQSLAFARVM